MTEPAPEPVEDMLAMPVLTQIWDCLCAELPSTVGGAPCFCGLRPGALIPMDYCDCNGKGTCGGNAFVNLMSVFPSKIFPQPDRLSTGCMSPLAARIQVGVYRCVPVVANPNSQGKAGAEPPTELQMMQATRVQMSDMAAIYRALVCCSKQQKKFTVEQYTPVGPAGGCGGGQWSVVVGLS